jgi:hypothetical protein
MECDEEELFAPLCNIVWLTDASVELNGITRVIAGEGVAQGAAEQGTALNSTYQIDRTLRTSDYTLGLLARSDGSQLTNELPSSMRSLILVMLLAVPLLAFVIWAFYRYVTVPLERLVDAARHVKRGERGYAISRCRRAGVSLACRALQQHVRRTQDAV